MTTTSNPPGSESKCSSCCGGGSIVLLGRILFSMIFVFSGISHFMPSTIQFAAGKVPMPGLLVPASGAVALLGGLSIAFGYRARLGALLIALFLVPVTLTMHAFWMEKDPTMKLMQMAMFMKNLSMLGGALIIAGLGAGPLSLDARRKARKFPSG